ncbi:UNVERIFIED_CONTAM: Glycerophosphocholine phosphodiesterase GPCPD1 [Trichonephila clavipes]
MRTICGVRDLAIQVRAETAVGETVFISGNTLELGEWKVSEAIQLVKVSAEGNIWQTIIHVPTNQNVLYRYLICTVVDNEGKPENVVRYWESHLRPRILRPIDYIDGKGDLDVFGYQGDSECIAKGWLTSETVVQLKMFNSPVTIWKRRYRDKRVSIHVSTIDITRKDSVTDIIGMEEDSTLTEGINTRGWPIVEVAQMNDTGYQFAPQNQFGILYDPTEYVIFQIQVMQPNSIVSANILFPSFMTSISRGAIGRNCVLLHPRTSNEENSISNLQSSLQLTCLLPSATVFQLGFIIFTPNLWMLQ